MVAHPQRGPGSHCPPGCLGCSLGTSMESQAWCAFRSGPTGTEAGQWAGSVGQASGPRPWPRPHVPSGTQTAQVSVCPGLGCGCRGSGSSLRKPSRSAQRPLEVVPGWGAWAVHAAGRGESGFQEPLPSDMWAEVGTRRLLLAGPHQGYSVMLEAAQQPHVFVITRTSCFWTQLKSEISGYL